MQYIQPQPRFVALEGIKGAGKSTLALALMEALTPYLEEPIQLFRPTRASAPYLWERTARASFLCRNEFFLNELYIRRARAAARAIDWRRPTLGDRSLLTSFACRLPTKSSLIASHIERQLQREPLNPWPGQVIWLHLPPETAHLRLKNRREVRTNQHHESLAALHSQHLGYQALYDWSRKIGLPSWQLVDARQPTDQLVEKILPLLLVSFGVPHPDVLKEQNVQK